MQESKSLGGWRFRTLLPGQTGGHFLTLQSRGSGNIHSLQEVSDHKWGKIML